MPQTSKAWPRHTHFNTIIFIFQCLVILFIFVSIFLRIKNIKCRYDDKMANPIINARVCLVLRTIRIIIKGPFLKASRLRWNLNYPDFFFFMGWSCLRVRYFGFFIEQMGCRCCWYLKICCVSLDHEATLMSSCFFRLV